MTKAPAAAYHEAEGYKAISYFRVQRSLSQMKGCLAEGFPFVFGFTVYDSLYNAQGHPVTVLPMPGGSDNAILANSIHHNDGLGIDLGGDRRHAQRCRYRARRRHRRQ